MLLGLSAGERARDLHDGVRAATASTAPTRCRTTRRCCRRPSAGRCACSSTRQDEMAWENYGFAFVIDERVGARRRRHHRRLGSRVVVADARRPAGRQRARERRHRFSRGLRAAAFAPRTPAPDPPTLREQQQRRAVVRHGRGRGRSGGTGTVQSERVLTHNVQSPFFTGPLRSPSRLQNTFAHESFMDEVAAARKGGSGRLSAASSQRPAAHRRRQGRGEGGAAGRRVPRRASVARRDRRGAGPGHVVRALRRRQRLLRDGGRSRREPGHRPA